MLRLNIDFNRAHQQKLIELLENSRLSAKRKSYDSLINRNEYSYREQAHGSNLQKEQAKPQDNLKLECQTSLWLSCLLQVVKWYHTLKN